MAETKNAPDAAGVEPARDRDAPPWDEMRPAGTSGGLGGISADAAMYAGVAAFAVAIGVVNGLSAAQDAARRGAPYEPGRLLFWELSSIAFILVGLPILVLAVRQIRSAPSWALRSLIATIAVVLFSSVHIAGMVGIRKLALWAVGSRYEFGASPATLLYEFRKDLVTCLLIGSIVWLAKSRRELLLQRPREPAAPSAAPQPPSAIWLRDGTSRIRLDPRQILWVASAGNYIEYRLMDGAEHLIRGTLATAEAELAPFHIVRVHRTKLANLDRVTGIAFKPAGDFELRFENGQTLQGSRRYRAAVSTPDSPAAPSA